MTETTKYLIVNEKKKEIHLANEDKVWGIYKPKNEKEWKEIIEKYFPELVKGI